MKKNLRLAKNNIYVWMIITFFCSCENRPQYSNPSQFYNSTQEIPSWDNESSSSVEVIEEGEAEILDKTEGFDTNSRRSVTNSAINRMKELMQDDNYIWGNGNYKRIKIAHELNNEGYRKANGDKFRRRDIPK